MTTVFHNLQMTNVYLTILSISNIQTRGFNKFQTKDMDRVGETTVAVAAEEALGKDMEDRPTAVTVESEN